MNDMPTRKKERRRQRKLNSQRRHWWVYVLELDSAALAAAGRIASSRVRCVYVGQTGKTVEERIDQHLTASEHIVRVVRDHFTGEIEKFRRGPFLSVEASLRRERKTAVALEARGYRVWGGQGEEFMSRWVNPATPEPRSHFSPPASHFRQTIPNSAYPPSTNST